MALKINRYQHIEEKYSVEQGDDWLAVRLSAQFQPKQRVRFAQPATKTKDGVVIDLRRMTQFGAPRWEFLVKYDNMPIARWTNPKWLTLLTPPSSTAPTVTPRSPFAGTPTGHDFKGGELAQLRAQIAQLQAENAALKRERNDARETVTELETRVDEQAAELTALKRRLPDFRPDNMSEGAHIAVSTLRVGDEIFLDRQWVAVAGITPLIGDRVKITYDGSKLSFQFRPGWLEHRAWATIFARQQVRTEEAA